MISRYVARAGRNWYTPTIVDFTGTFTSGTIVVTPAVAPIEGDLLLMQIASSGLSDWATDITAPAGWTRLGLSASRTALWYKFATASEPSSYSFLNPAGTKGWEYMNFRGMSNRTEILTIVSQQQITVPGTYTSASFIVPRNGVAISILGKNTTTIWTASAGWTTLSASGQAKAAYKIFTGAAGITTGETITWALSPPGSTSTSITTVTYLFTAKFNQH